jgi:hypothetical protein
MKNREVSLSLTRAYPCAWKSYSQVESHKNGEFKYLALASDPGVLEPPSAPKKLNALPLQRLRPGPLADADDHELGGL